MCQVNSCEGMQKPHIPVVLIHEQLPLLDVSGLCGASVDCRLLSY